MKKVSDQARTRMKEGYDKKVKSARIHIEDKVLVKILKFDGKHKIEDKYEDTIYKVTDQPIQDTPVFDVQSDEGVIKRLHRHHLFLLSFIDHESESEETGDKEDNSQSDSQKKDKTGTEHTTAVGLNRTDNSDLEVKDDDRTDTQHAEMTEEKTVDRNDNDEEDDEDYDKVTEYVH